MSAEQDQTKADAETGADEATVKAPVDAASNRDDDGTDAAGSTATDHGAEPEAGDAESFEAAGDDASAESVIDGLRMQLQQREDALLRLQAELENLRKRGQRDVENAHKFGLEKLIAALLPVKDSMELGLASASDTELGALHEGMSLTDKMFAGVLEKFGVAVVDPAGETFDPERHQAMSMQEVEGTPAGTVVTVYQKGYMLNDRLVRPAMVIVAR